MAQRRARHRVKPTQGFTLVELLVALALMALMAGLSWRGLDGMTRAQTQMRQNSDDVLTLQAGLAQWSADLDALAQQPGTPSLDCSFSSSGSEYDASIRRHSTLTGSRPAIVRTISCPFCTVRSSPSSSMKPR